MAYFDQTALRAEITKATAWLREQIGDNDVGGRFTLEIEIKGSPDKADATLRFGFDVTRNYGTSVHSPRMDSAVKELLRRMGFDQANSAELLTYDPVKAAETERLQTPVPAAPEPQTD